MNQTPIEVRTANLIYLVFWVLTVIIIFFVGKRWSRLHSFRERMVAQWQPALVISAIFLVSSGLAGNGFLNLHGLTLFCQSLIGLALARSIPDFEPLPVAKALKQQKKAWVQLLLMVVIAAVIALPASAIGAVGIDIGRQIFGETDYTAVARGSFPENPWVAFLMLLGGAGLAEEIPFRLVCLSFFWHLTRRRKLSILLAAIAFGAYHLTPLNGMYQIFLQYPISQFLGSLLIGLIWGTLYVRRGFETTALGHTLSNWLPFMLFRGG